MVEGKRREVAWVLPNPAFSLRLFTPTKFIWRPHLSFLDLNLPSTLALTWYTRWVHGFHTKKNNKHLFVTDKCAFGLELQVPLQCVVTHLSYTRWRLIYFYAKKTFLKSGKYSACVTLLCLLGISIFNVLLFIHGFTHCVIIFILLRFLPYCIWRVSVCVCVLCIIWGYVSIYTSVLKYMTGYFDTTICDCTAYRQLQILASLHVRQAWVYCTCTLESCVNECL